jgi:hypothetical protein
MSGWIKSYRQLLDNPVVCKDADHFAVWHYILLSATHKPIPVMFGGEKIILQPGQLITGRKAIAEKFSIDESKVTRILKSFENEQQIEQQTSNKNRIITVLSWSKYQDVEQQDEQQMNNKRTTNEQQMNTNKKLRTKEPKKEIIKELKTYSPETVELTAHLIEMMKLNNPNVKVPGNLNIWHDAMDKLQRLDKYDFMQIRSVIDWCQNDSFWKGNILSAPKLREKMDTLVMRIQEQQNRQRGNRQLSQFEKIQQIAVREAAAANEQNGGREAGRDLFGSL